MTKQNFHEVLSKYDFTAILKKEKNARVRMRLLGLQNLKEGKTMAQVARTFKVTWKTVQSWKKKLEQEGLNGLKDKPRTGRKSYLGVEQEIAFKESLKELLQQKGAALTAMEIQLLLKEKFQVSYKRDSIYRLLPRLK